MDRRKYATDITVNGKKIYTVLIDAHYEAKHSASIDDDLILKLVNQMDGWETEPDSQDSQFSYFVNDRMRLNKKLYKLVWLMEKNDSYIGIINAYRRD